MAERFLPTEDPVMEAVLQWTVAREAQDVRRLLEWLPEARSSRERRALLDRISGRASLAASASHSERGLSLIHI